jgi:flagellar basal body-associated protein FliL
LKAGIIAGALLVQIALAWFVVNWLVSRNGPPADAEQVAATEEGGHGKEGEAKEAKKGEKAYEFGAVFAIPDLIINPKGSAGRRVFKISVSLEYDPANAELAKELEERQPFMRDYLITYLSGMNEDSLSDISYRETIRDSLGVAMNHFLSAGTVDRVLFQDFIRQ